MTIEWQEQLRPGVALRAIVAQATAALVAMDAERLEELAKCCADLNREIDRSGESAAAALELRDAGSEIRLLDRVLYETRANLTVLSRLHAIRLREAMVSSPMISFAGSRSASAGPSSSILIWTDKVADYGDN
jgi:mRNA degradation ribonuclease J1/J2